MTLYKPEHLQPWTVPDSWYGQPWHGYYVFLSQHRDSDALTRSNFECCLKEIGGESETVIVVRERHWAVGWIEWIAIHESDEQALMAAEEIVCALSDYPVLDESHFSELEWNEACEQWERMSVADRVELCREAGVSIFAARRDEMPSDDSGYILEQLR